MVKVAFFDLGGVVFKRGWRIATRQKWESQLGLPDGAIFDIVESSDLSVRADGGLLTEADVWHEFASMIGAAEFAHEMSQDTWEWDRHDADLLAFIESLRPQFRTAYLSNAWPGTRSRIHRAGLDDRVDQIFISSELGVAKPDPKTHELACDGMGVEPSEAVFVDDVQANVDAARAFGLQAVLHVDTGQTIAAVRGLMG